MAVDPGLVAALSAPSDNLFPTAGDAAPRQMPGPGFIPGDLHLNPTIAPNVPQGVARPFAPGEWVQNPDGSWSSEISVTVQGDPSFNGGRPTVIPSIWIKDGRPYVAKNEDEATELAKASGLKFPSFSNPQQAEKFSTDREQQWQGLRPQDASKVAPLWEYWGPSATATPEIMTDANSAAAAALSSPDAGKQFGAQVRKMLAEAPEGVTAGTKVLPAGADVHLAFDTPEAQQWFSGRAESQYGLRSPQAVRQQVVEFWQSKGAPQHVAEGIADRVGAESDYNPTEVGDSGTSLGLYQHHADRLMSLMATGSPTDVQTQNEQAFREVMGGDPIAAAHWKEIVNAPTRQAAAILWDRYFERSAGGPGATGRSRGTDGSYGVPDFSFMLSSGGSAPAPSEPQPVSPELRAALTAPAPEVPPEPAQFKPQPVHAASHAALNAPPPGTPATAYRDAIAKIMAAGSANPFAQQ